MEKAIKNWSSRFALVTKLNTKKTGGGAMGNGVAPRVVRATSMLSTLEVTTDLNTQAPADTTLTPNAARERNRGPKTVRISF